MKKAAAVIAMIALAALPLMAAGQGGASGTYSRDGIDASEFSSNMAAVLAGVIPGMMVAAKFVWDIVKAYSGKEQDPYLLRKALIGLGITLMALVLYTRFIGAMGFGKDPAADSFFKGLSMKGAEAPLGNTF